MACALIFVGCGDATGNHSSPDSGANRPNILLVVWDTVRADHLSLYGYQRQTTPHLDQWAEQARVFENCITVGSTTVPAHGSMFTGLMPTEHGASNQAPYLPDGLETLAELLRANGYSTYMFAENPHICAANNFTQGFDVVEHPWDPQYSARALQIVMRRISPVGRPSKAPNVAGQNLNPWIVLGSGELAHEGVESWLREQDPSRPFFIFLNYMEAHHPPTPYRRYREQMMTPAEVKASYKLGRSWRGVRSFGFGLRDYSPKRLELIGAMYDAALLDLDDLFQKLLESLRTGGHLDNTVVVLVSDHGEHLGEHHLLDHQFSVYEPLMRVPLVLYYPPRFSPGRDKRPVTNLDLFPTLLQLAGIEPPASTMAVSLLDPPAQRPRIGEYPAVMTEAFDLVRETHPDFDPSPWNRTLRAYYEGPYKLIEASDGNNELYNLENDPKELQNLYSERPNLAQRLVADLDKRADTLHRVLQTRPVGPTAVDVEQLRRLEALGYTGTDEDSGQDEKTEGNEPP